MNNTDKKPLVQIAMITYNHECYLRSAIEGVLNQSTSFSYQLVIGEDHSTDNTLEICQQFQSKYPEKIVLLRGDKNLGMMENFVRTIDYCEAKYVAICEGDDFWTDSQKLQTQIDFLEKESDYSFSAHRVASIDEDAKFIKSVNPKIDSDLELTISNFIGPYHREIHTCSYVIRKSAITPLPDWFTHVWAGDHFIASLAMLKGRGICHRNNFASYRIIPGGQSIRQPAVRLRMYEKNMMGHLQLLKLIKRADDLVAYKHLVAKDYMALLDYSIAAADRKKMGIYIRKVFSSTFGLRHANLKILSIGIIKYLIPFKLKPKETIKGI